MDRLLLVVAAPLAALAFSSAPAEAQFAGTPPMSAPPGQFDRFSALPTVHRGVGLDGKRHHRRRHRGLPGVVVVGGGGWNDAWALYNNRSWEPDSFNDWWHDRPDRAYPRWVRNNQNCDRMWWGGGVWRCSW